MHQIFACLLFVTAASSQLHRQLQPLPPLTPSRDLSLHSATEMRQNHGVVFHKLPKMIMAGHSMYDLIFKIPIPSIASSSLQLNMTDCSKTSFTQSWCSLFKGDELTQLQEHILTMDKHYAAISAILDSPLDTKNSNRPTRGLFDFIGKASRSLFGTATVSDVRRVAAMVEQLDKGIKTQSKSQKLMLNTLAVTLNSTKAHMDILSDKILINNNEISAIVDSMAKWKETMQKMKRGYNELYYRIQELQKYVDDTVEKRIVMLNAFKIAADKLGKFVSALHSLVSGQVSSNLISPEELSHTIRSLKQKLQTQKPGYHLVHEELSFYYNHHLSMYLHTETHLYVHLFVPIAKENTLFELYEISTFPLPIHTSDNSQPGYTLVSDLPDLFAVDVARNNYFHLSSKQLSKCNGKNLLICSETFLKASRSTYTCPSVIFFHTDTLYKQHCTTKVYPTKKIPTSALEISPGKFYISSHKSLETLCGDDITKTTVCSFCKVHVPCSCTLLVDRFKLTPSLSSCDDAPKTLVLEHTVNYPVLLHFDLPTNIILSHEHSNVTVDLAVPDLASYVRNFTDLTRMEKESGLELETLATAVKEARDSYREPESVDDSLINLPFMDSDDFQDLFVIVASLLIAILFLGFIYILIKLRKLSTERASGYVPGKTEDSEFVP